MRAVVPRTDGRYTVDDEGGVYGPSGRRLKPRLGHDGRYYVQTNTARGAPQKNRAVHVMILESFVGPRPEGHDADHINHEPTDNRLTNLRWLPVLLNRGEGGRRGGQRGRAPGERNGRSKVSDAERAAMRKAYAEEEGARSIAARYPITLSAVFRIVRGTQRTTEETS